GRVLAREFGFAKPTEVILEYQIDDNRFSMTVIKDEDLVILSTDQDVADNSEISEDNSEHDSPNDSDLENFLSNYFDNDRILSWKLKVSKAYADKKKQQVLHFPPDTAEFVIKEKKFVYIETPHKLSGIKCTVQKARRKKAIKEKYLTKGWYQWVRANELMEGDELRFQMDPLV
ncbi:hypothetical protein L195_g052446, partial [Trifolium pratense]